MFILFKRRLASEPSVWMQRLFLFSLKRAMPWRFIVTVNMARFRILGNTLLSVTVRMFLGGMGGRGKAHPNVGATTSCVGRPGRVKDGEGESQMGTDTSITPGPHVMSDSCGHHSCAVPAVKMCTSRP